MKKQMFIFSILFLSIYMVSFNCTIFRSMNYEVVNEKGDIIPYEINYRTDIKATKEKIEGMNIVFEDLDEVFIYFPDEQIFALSNNKKSSHRGIFKIFEHQQNGKYTVICHKDWYNPYFQLEDGFVFSGIRFFDNYLELDSFYELKKYGERIIIKQKGTRLGDSPNSDN